MMMKFSVPLCLLLAVASVQAFVSPSSSSAFMRTQRQIGGASSSLTNAQILRTGNHGAFRPLQMSEEDSSSEDSSVSVDVPQVVEPVKPNEPEGSSYPLDVPSPLLLASSMVLAIGATGSVFELSGGNPVIGLVPTVLIIVAGFPLCFFLFYAAIKKGAAETEEDDAKFTRGDR